MRKRTHQDGLLSRRYGEYDEQAKSSDEVLAWMRSSRQKRQPEI
jgi:hypothetical protein